LGVGALTPDYLHETALGGHVAGVDEAGRGPLAGPVVAAAVILDVTRTPAGLDDSKKLSAARRAALFDYVMAQAQVGVGIVHVEDIDRINILQATMLAMRRAVAALPAGCDAVLVDGNRSPDWPHRTQTVVGGDARCLSIAAASIIAKVTRDRLMTHLAGQHPGYGWDRNMGYGTAEHLVALARLGVTVHHRRSFAPVRNALAFD
jgi:ribonuclease HII